MKTKAILSLLLLVSIFAACSHATQQQEPREISESVKWNGKQYDLISVHPKKHQIRMDWKDDVGENFRSITNYEEYLSEKGENALMITNAGIFMEDGTPLGLYVEDGKVQKETNRVQDAYGNFYMQPNGIFYLKDDLAEIMPTSKYDPTRMSLDFATQSGPLLVIDGEINDQFNKESKNLKLRSGVGVDLSGNAIFAISQGPVSFYEFATLFREKYSCPNALYLDGVISRMYLPGIERTQKGGNFGAFISVLEKEG